MKNLRRAPFPQDATLLNKRKTRSQIITIMIVQIIFVAALLLICGTASAQEKKELTNFNDTTFTLHEVTVKSSLPKTRVKGDAMRTLVTGSILEKAGTATDVLKRIPQLKADDEGGVEVFGRGAAEIYINGRKVQDQKELTRLSSEQIKSIDVVQNPGARYAASTKAVVRIQLKKSQGEGISIIDRANAMYKYKHAFDNNLDVNYRTGGLDITGSFWCGSYHHNKSFQENETRYFVGPDSYYSKMNQEIAHAWEGLSPQIQINYMANENHSFGAFYKYDNNPKERYDGMFYSDASVNGEFLERSESNIYRKRSFRKHIFNAYYSGKIGNLSIDFNIDGLFDDSKDRNGTKEYTTDAAGNAGNREVKNLTQNKNNFIASKLIFSYPVWKGNLSVGGEYSHNRRSDIYSYVSEAELPMTATDNDIRETAASGFIEYGRQFGRLFAQIGLRYEGLDNKYYNFGEKEDDVSRCYGNWFPTVVLAMPIGKMQLNVSYRKDIQRPAYSQLSSSMLYINKYTYQSGNPYLRPTYTHNIAFNAAYKEFNLAVNYARTKDVVTLFAEPYPGDDPLLSLLHPKNSSDGYDKLTISPAYRPVIGCWHPMWSAGIILQNYKTLTAEGTMMTMGRPFCQLSWNNDIVLPKGLRINCGMFFNTKGDYDNFRMTSNTFSLSCGIQRDFNMKAWGVLTADLRCYDILNTAKTGTTVYGIREVTSSNPARRTFSLGLTWKYNEARSKYKGTGAGNSQKARM